MTSTIRGVPQYSLLGPILYFLFTLDLPTPNSHNTMIATFADDTVIMSAAENLTTAINSLQTHINTTTEWFNNWGIKINESKPIGTIYTNKRIRNDQR